MIPVECCSGQVHACNEGGKLLRRRECQKWIRQRRIALNAEDVIRGKRGSHRRILKCRASVEQPIAAANRHGLHQLSRKTQSWRDIVRINASQERILALRHIAQIELRSDVSRLNEASRRRSGRSRRIHLNCWPIQGWIES